MDDNALVAHQPGLRWRTGDDLEQHCEWTIIPDPVIIEKIARERLNIAFDQPCNVAFFAEGTYNKVYSIRTADNTLLFRVSLPVDPGRKVASEVATLEFIRRFTTTPVPRVIDYNPSHDNELGFEWMMIEKMPGRPLGEVWKHISWEAKVKLVKQIAEHNLELFRTPSRGIGSLYLDDRAVLEQLSLFAFPDPLPRPPFITLQLLLTYSARIICHIASKVSSSALNLLGFRRTTPIPGFTLGPLVQPLHFTKTAINATHLPRGPYPTSAAWQHARLAFQIHHARSRLVELSNRSRSRTRGPGIPAPAAFDTLFQQRTLYLCQRLRRVISAAFASPPSSDPDNAQQGEMTVLTHPDLHPLNVLVDDRGALTALLDWECVVAVPRWCAVTRGPLFLTDVGVKERTCREDAEDGVRDGREVSESEMRRLGRVYWGYLRERELGWREAEREGLRADVDFAVEVCGEPEFQRDVEEWVYGWEQGRGYGLRGSVPRW